jgi:prefoldin alpha subunit
MTEDMQQNMLMYQLLQKHLETLKQQATMLDQRMAEVKATEEALKEMGDSKEELLIPLGSGFYIKGKTTDSESVLVNLGAGVLAKKTVKDGLKALDEHKNSIEEGGKRLEKEITDVVGKIQKIGEVLEKAQPHEHKH